jgi:hypothetical protein
LEEMGRQVRFGESGYLHRVSARAVEFRR